ncbi:MOB kinase activator 3A [Camelus dromedarius]|uniref:MOB kinase activator 3A n=1 Tax=Camelus dromedarius TaxID=9838 RepID=A0A5N4CKX3_CAMDR|nr:MOB kinase activator 3A [Camelus dromedarius]
MSNPFLKQVFNKDKTFRPKRKFEPGTQRFELHKKAQASLNAGLDLKLAVQLPAGEELNDWVAVHVVDFFNRVNLIYGTISDGCTERSCPIMSGGPKYEYRWQDEHRFRRPTALSAPRYMDLLMDWIELQINDEGARVPQELMRWEEDPVPALPRVRARLHPPIRPHRAARLRGHVNTCYKHFYYFVTEFGLIDTKELEPLNRPLHVPTNFTLKPSGVRHPCGYRTKTPHHLPAEPREKPLESASRRPWEVALKDFRKPADRLIECSSF